MGNSLKKIKINVDDSILGKTAAENIYNNLGVLVISKGSILNGSSIEKLVQLKYDELWVFDDSVRVIGDGKFMEEKQKKQENEELYKMYRKTRAVIENIMEDIEYGHRIKFDTLYEISDKLIDKVSNNDKILQIMEYFMTIDRTIYGHYMNVGLLCLMMGKWIGYSKIKARDLICAGLLHDIKEIRMADKYFNEVNNGSSKDLNDKREYDKSSYKNIEKALGMNKDIALGVLQSHEREDGSGYPMGIKGEKIHDFAKIIAIVDTYDNLISHYVYQSKQSPFKVLEIFENHSFGLFHPKYLKLFLKNISCCYIGDTVTLNTGKQAEIVFINTNFISKPIVKVNDTYIDLFKDKEINII